MIYKLARSVLRQIRVASKQESSSPKGHATLPLADRINPKQRQNPTSVVTKLDAIFHENMLPKHQREG